MSVTTQNTQSSVYVQSAIKLFDSSHPTYSQVLDAQMDQVNQLYTVIKEGKASHQEIERSVENLDGDIPFYTRRINAVIADPTSPLGYGAGTIQDQTIGSQSTIKNFQARLREATKAAEVLFNELRAPGSFLIIKNFIQLFGFGDSFFRIVLIQENQLATLITRVKKGGYPQKMIEKSIENLNDSISIYHRRMESIATDPNEKTVFDGSIVEQTLGLKEQGISLETFKEHVQRLEKGIEELKSLSALQK